MNFLNQPLAWGALAFSIPVILHILNRSRFRRIEWGAMHLLESVVKVNHRRFRFEQWLLLMVRCAIPVLLALTLAKPVLTGSQALSGDAPVSLVILLDTSYSMATVQNQSTRFQDAVDAACAILAATTRSSEIAVIQTGGSPAPLFDQPLFDSEAVIRRLRTLKASDGASNMPRSLEVGLATLARMTHGRRELIVISDFQSADWSDERDMVQSVRQQIDAMTVPAELTLMQVGQTIESNVAVESLDFSSRPLGVGQQLTVRANLRNYGDSAAPNARVSLNVDGAEHSVSTVTLAARNVTQALFPVTFDQPGSHVIEVHLQSSDALPSDNHSAAAVTVWDRIDVLLVDGDPSSQALKSETDFLAVALTPYSFDRQKLADLAQTRTVTADQMPADQLSPYRVIVLANVAKLSETQVAAVREYVSNGGALLVTSGNRLDTRWYNETLFRDGTDLLPAEIGPAKGKIDAQGQSARIVAQHFDAPALQFFNEAANGDLSTAEVRQWYELKPRATTSHGNTAHQNTAGKKSAHAAVRDLAPIVAARLDTGDPLLVERTFGNGIVVQMATACDADWSDLPMRLFYVPLMQQVVTTMAAQLTPPRNIRTGEPAVALLPPDSANAPLSVVTPDGSRHALQAVPQGNNRLARFEATRQPGVYTITAADSAAIHFVASTESSESDPTVLNQEERSRLAERLGAKSVASPTDYLQQDRLRREGREIWEYVLTAFVVFLFVELILQQRFARVRT